MAMTDQFYCVKPGGIHRGDLGPKSTSPNENEELIILEGSAEEGPWYNAFQFSDEQIEYYLDRNWIKFMDKKVE